MCLITLQTKPVVRSVAQQPNWLNKKATCAANVGWLAGPKPVGATKGLGVGQATGWQLAGSTNTAKQTLWWAMALANYLINY